MKTDVLEKYLRFLRDEAKKLYEKQWIDIFDLESLKRELELLKSKSKECTEAHPLILERIQHLRIKVDEKYLEGTKKNIWINIFRLVTFGSVASRALEDRSLEKIKGGIEEFLSDIESVLFEADALQN